MATSSWSIMWPGAVCLQQCSTLVSVSFRTGALRCVYVWLRWNWFIRPGQCCHAPAVLYWACVLWCRLLVLYTDWMYSGHSHLPLLLRLKSPLSTTISIYSQGTWLLSYESVSVYCELKKNLMQFNYCSWLITRGENHFPVKPVSTCLLVFRDAPDPIFYDPDPTGSRDFGSGRIRIFTRSGCNLIRIKAELQPIVCCYCLSKHGIIKHRIIKDNSQNKFLICCDAAPFLTYISTYSCIITWNCWINNELVWHWERDCILLIQYITDVNWTCITSAICHWFVVWHWVIKHSACLQWLIGTTW